MAAVGVPDCGYVRCVGTRGKPVEDLGADRATLVAPVGWDERSVGTTGCPRAFFPALQLAVRAFRLKVDELLPGAYAWFSTDSLHVTVRGLFG